MNVENVVNKIKNIKSTNSLPEMQTDNENEVIYAPLNYKKCNFGFMVFSKEETEIESNCKYKHRYYYYENFGNNKDKNIIFIMFNPSTACPDKDDQTIRNCRSLVKDEYKSMEIINIFSERNSKEGKFTDDVFDNNLDFIEEFLNMYNDNRNEQEVVIAWGYAKDKDYPTRIKNIMKKLEGFTKKKIIVQDGVLEEAQNLARHPNQAFWKGFDKKLKDFNKIAEITEY